MQAETSKAIMELKATVDKITTPAEIEEKK